MESRNPFRNAGSLFRIGMLALLASIALMWAVRAAGADSSNLLDLIRGVLAGISIACLFQAMRLRRQASNGPQR